MRRNIRITSSALITSVIIFFLCAMIVYFSYQLFFSGHGIDHLLARTLLDRGMPITGDSEYDLANWDYPIRSVIYALFQCDLGNPRSLLDNGLPFLAAFNIKQQQNWTQRPFVFIPELSFQPDPVRPVPEPQVSVSPMPIMPVGEPQVLIYHTHTSEMYLGKHGIGNTHYVFSSASDRKITGVMEVGNHLAKALQSQGIPVMHETQIHDWPSLTGSYVNSERSVRNILNRYDSVQYVFDLHRDANVPNPVVTIDGRKVARVLLVVGTAESIPQSHPNWKKNAEFAQAVYQLAEKMYPGLMRPIQVRQDARYNQHLHPRSVVLEIGSVENTIDEALLAAELVATVIAQLIN